MVSQCSDYQVLSYPSDVLFWILTMLNMKEAGRDIDRELNT